MSEHDPLPPGAPAEGALAVVGSRAGSRRAQTRRRSGCLPILLVLVLFVGVVAWFARGAISDVKDMFAGPEDYPGPGKGEIFIVVDPGQNGRSIGQELRDLGVVKSVDAFTDAAAEDPKSNSIQPGSYPMKKKMKAADALKVLIDPGNVVTTTISVPEGFTVKQIVARLAKESDRKAAAFTKVLKKPRSIGLPAYARGNPEGYLFPATYSFGPDASPKDMLSAMVRRYQQALGDNDIAKIAGTLGQGYTPEQIMTVASLVEAEGRGDDMAKIARAIYNRLELPNGGGTNGRLQIDASVLYALGTRDTAKLVSPLAELTSSPYNTYRYAGLPPGPIGAPGEEAIKAALNPTKGPWLYWVTVDCKGTTKFSTTLEEHTRQVAVNGAEC
ncbi:MAG: endolytic transglycosylase MltG [Nocardioidaceae bacterium]|nr:endolytic transglycosylase MltG [Nocardioidaceae bacterium]